MKTNLIFTAEFPFVVGVSLCDVDYDEICLTMKAFHHFAKRAQLPNERGSSARAEVKNKWNIRTLQ